MFVLTNSVLMQFIPSPADHSAGSAVGSLTDSFDKAAFRLRGRHQAAYGFLARGGIDAESPQQGIEKKTQRDIFVRLFHRFQYSLDNIRE
jgi:hypothetical protein